MGMFTALKSELESLGSGSFRTGWLVKPLEKAMSLDCTYMQLKPEQLHTNRFRSA
jgi:hypothetical protein